MEIKKWFTGRSNNTDYVELDQKELSEVLDRIKFLKEVETTSL